VKSEFLEIAQKVLSEERRSLTPRQIWEIGHDRKYFSDKIAGKTPYQTMKAKLSVHVRTQGDASLFVRTKPGHFYLRELLEGTKPYDAPPLRPPRTSERVLVFETLALDRFMDFHGVLAKNPKRRLRDILANVPHAYRPRLEVEQDFAWTQIVTYVLVMSDGAILSYKRGTYNRLDAFLRGSRCVGFGGHVSERDHDLFTRSDLGIRASAARELAEEISLPSADIVRLQDHTNLRVIGLLNDDSSDNGRRHLAVVFGYEVSGRQEWETPRRGEKSITQLQWLGRGDERQTLLWDFEYWSQLCLRQYAPKLTRNTTAYWFRHVSRLRPPAILCVCGSVGSGKSEATRVLVERFGYREVNSGRVVAALLGMPPVPQTGRAEFQAAARRFIESPSGPGRLASAIWAEVETDTSHRVLVDGLRQRATVEELSRLAASSNRRLGLIFVHTSIDQAYRFYCERMAVAMTFAEFLALRRAPVEGETEAMLSHADAVLFNWTGKVEYQHTIVRLMGELRIGKPA